jgi:dynein light chain LC8-type
MQEFDRLHGQGWQCIVGRDFGCFVTHQFGCFIYFTIGTLCILLFRGAVTSEEEMGRQIVIEPVQS